MTLMVIAKDEVADDCCTAMTRIVHGCWEAVRAFVPESEMLLTGPTTSSSPPLDTPHPQNSHDSDRAGNKQLGALSSAL